MGGARLCERRGEVRRTEGQLRRTEGPSRLRANEVSESVCVKQGGAMGEMARELVTQSLLAYKFLPIPDKADSTLTLYWG